MKSLHRQLVVIVACLASLSIPSIASATGKAVPFKGNWFGHTVSAFPTPADPFVIDTVAEGDGVATQLGHYSMVSPHFSHILTLEADGTQIFEAANGDLLTASFTGQFAPAPGGYLIGVLHATITGGTGRFRHATGSYTFHILFDPATFDSIAVFEGAIAK